MKGLVHFMWKDIMPSKIDQDRQSMPSFHELFRHQPLRDRAPHLLAARPYNPFLVPWYSRPPTFVWINQPPEHHIRLPSRLSLYHTSTTELPLRIHMQPEKTHHITSLTPLEGGVRGILPSVRRHATLPFLWIFHAICPHPPCPVASQLFTPGHNK